MSYAGEVIDYLPGEMQDYLAAASEYQRAIAPEAAEALRAGELSPGLDDETRGRAADILDNYGAGRLTQDGFDHVPLSSQFGTSVLPDSLSALTTYRVPVLGSTNEFGMRPVVPENKANYAAFLAINGVGVEQMIAFNTASNANHVAVVSHDGEGEGGLTRSGGRILPVDGQGEKLTADAVIITNPENRMGIVGSNADNPIVVGTAGEAMFIVNGGWHNLAAGVDLATRQKLAELGLLHGSVQMAVGAGAREGFELPREALRERSNLRQALGGDPGSYKGSIDIKPHGDPTKTNLELAHWAQAAAGVMAVRGGIVGMDLCTVDAAKAGFMHSSRVHREHPTKPGEMAAGDRNMTALIPKTIQRTFGA
jgi:hypothetical protein